MSSTTDLPNLDSLEFLPYINDTGELPVELQNQIGIYAIFQMRQGF